jgi:RNA polymerase sigma-70 factor (ECF subfamily)
MNSQVQTPAERLENFRRDLTQLARRDLGWLRRKLTVEEVVQDAITEAWESLDTFHGDNDAQLWAWMRKIFYNRLNYWRRFFHQKGRDVNRERSLQKLLDESSACMEKWVAADQSSVGERIRRRERDERLARALEKLPEAQRMAVVLCDLENWTLADVGRHLGRQMSAVNGLLRRGREKLRTLLEGQE